MWAERIAIGDIVYFKSKLVNSHRAEFVSTPVVLSRCQAEGLEG